MHNIKRKLTYQRKRKKEYSEREYQKIRKEGPWVVISINETSEVQFISRFEIRLYLEYPMED